MEITLISITSSFCIMISSVATASFTIFSKTVLLLIWKGDFSFCFPKVKPYLIEHDWQVVTFWVWWWQKYFFLSVIFVTSLKKNILKSLQIKKKNILDFEQTKRGKVFHFMRPPSDTEFCSDHRSSRETFDLRPSPSGSTGKRCLNVFLLTVVRVVWFEGSTKATPPLWCHQVHTNGSDLSLWESTLSDGRAGSTSETLLISVL